MCKIKQSHNLEGLFGQFVWCDAHRLSLVVTYVLGQSSTYIKVCIGTLNRGVPNVFFPTGSESKELGATSGGYRYRI